MQAQMSFGEALAWLDRHVNLERILADHRVRAPDPDRMARFCHLMGDPQWAQPSIHITGTNGKTSTARALSQLLMAKGLTVGTFTSPHLEAINERVMANLEPISNEDFAEVLSALAALEPMVEDAKRPSWFELVTATGFRYFADKPVDVAVLEVGMGGRWDATRVAAGTTAVVTNVAIDHVEILGSTRESIAREKAGIIKPGATLVLGEADPGLYPIFEAEEPGTLWLAGRDFAVTANRMAVGGRFMDLATPGAAYTEVYLPLHGRHQADNFLAALVAAEAFFGRPIEAEIVKEAAAQLTSPGRLELVRQSPLVVLDGAKNVAGALTCAAAVAEEFGELARVLVVGMLKGKDPREMLQALDATRAKLVVACPPPSPRAQPAEVVAEAARSLGCPATVASSVGEALDVALQQAGGDDLVLVTGSLYVVGEARAALLGHLVPRP
jgi:dihydrofolate synthase/folylpolyglutamate synthase